MGHGGNITQEGIVQSMGHGEFVTQENIVQSMPHEWEKRCTTHGAWCCTTVVWPMTHGKKVAERTPDNPSLYYITRSQSHMHLTLVYCSLFEEPTVW